jgi:hypothetical protein
MPAADARRRVPGNRPPLDPDAGAVDYWLIRTTVDHGMHRLCGF